VAAELEPLDPEVRRLLDAAEPPSPTIDDTMRVRMRERLELSLAARVDSLPPRVRRFPRIRRALELGIPAAIGAAMALLAERAVLAPKAHPLASPVDSAAAPVTRPVPSEPPSEPPPQETPPATPSASPSPPAVVPSPRAEAPSPQPEAPSARPEASAARAVTRDDRLAAEGRLIDTARAALTHGDFVAALAATEMHSNTFPRGRLAEEREAIAIQALVGSGRGGDARARGALFHERYPQSLFSPLVDAALRAIP
jgi:hypothetical protein